MKRETGANPVRTRHRNKGAKPLYHWETGKMADAMIFQPGDLPDLKYKANAKTTSNWLYQIICPTDIFL